VANYTGNARFCAKYGIHPGIEISKFRRPRVPSILCMGIQWDMVSLPGVYRQEYYTLSTTEGSVFMMKRLLKTEKGARRVGARGDEWVGRDMGRVLKKVTRANKP